MKISTIIILILVMVIVAVVVVMSHSPIPVVRAVGGGADVKTSVVQPMYNETRITTTWTVLPPYSNEIKNWKNLNENYNSSPAMYTFAPEDDDCEIDYIFNWGYITGSRDLDIRGLVISDMRCINTTYHYALVEDGNTLSWIKTQN